ncbi:helix-turn-helix domain-containing protein [Sporosalibacterium faouarense]|uniref:helix-turn-helix domain-containing protein n=1 Tax=Sporosalibacterium faouarense TaxID=516123 RepID=UPI00141C8D9F|nr:helix-turn-helix transcriptional regulator [Sporosalibacterium faouarense]MTI46357.1 helix-turn-helix transcriptional regulator [Bacillota bacterium]
MLNGKKIRELRVGLGYTSKDIENLTRRGNYTTSISKSYLEEIERGDKRNPSFQKIEVLARILCCKLDDLILKIN